MDPWGSLPILDGMEVVAFTIIALAALLFAMMIWAGQHQS
jgi:hypothetical protein